MTAPQAVGRQWQTAIDKSTGRYFVRDPLTGNIQPVEQAEAADLLLNRGFQPVDEESAKEFHKAELFSQYGKDNPLEAVTTGLTRGLTGGLEDFVMEPDDAKLRQAVIDEHPWLGGLSEAASTLVGLGKFSKVARFTPVGLLDEAGQLITHGARKAVPVTSVTRALGTAAEGAAYGGIQSAREAHMYEQPLTVQQIASGMLGGAIIGGGLGGAVGLLERRGASMGMRLAADQEKRLVEALKPGLSDEELVAILKAEGINVTPSSLKVFQAGIYQDKDITPELLALASDSGPVGQALRKRLVGAGQDRAAAEARLAEALQKQHERDDLLREHYGGRIKKEHFGKLIDDSEESAMEQVFQAATPDAINTMAEHIAKSPVADDAARAFGVTRAELADKVRVGLATKDEAVQRGVADVLREHPLEQVRAPGATRPIVANDQELQTLAGADTLTTAPPDKTLADIDALGLENLKYLRTGMREESLAYARKQVEKGELGAPVEVSIYPDGVRVLQDGRHRMVAAKEAGVDSLRAKVRFYDDDGNIVRELETDLSILGRKPRDTAVDSMGGRTVVGPTPGGKTALEAEPTTIDRDTVYDPRMAKADLREQAGLGQAYHELGELDRRYPALGLQAREAVQKHGLTQEGWKALAKDYPALETGEAMRLLARAKQEIEATGATFGKMGGVVPPDPSPGLIPEAPRQTRVPMWRHEATKALREVREQFEFLTSMPKGYVADKKFGDVARMLDVVNGAEGLILAGRKLDAFAELDYVKKRLGQVARPGQVLPAGAWPAQKAREAYERLRLVLEDESLWGRGAAAQRQFNERLHQRLARQDGVEGRYMKDAGVPHARDPWRNAKRVDLAGVRRFIDEMSGDTGAPALKGLSDHIDEGAEINRLMKEYFDLEPGAARAVADADAATAEARQALKEALDAAKREKQMATLQGRHGPSYGARGLLWAVLGGAPGAVAAHVADQVMNPGRAIYWRGVLERFANQTESKAAAALARIATKGPGAVVDATSGAAKATARAIPKVKHIFDDVMSEDYLSRVRTYNATIKELSGVASGTGLTEQLTGRLGDTMMVAPQLLPKLAEQAQKTAQVLLLRAPAQPANDFWGDDVAPVSDTQMQDFFRAYEIATDPTKLLELIENGELMPGDIEVAQEVAPEMVAWMQQKVAEQMAGSKPPYETRVQVSILMDMPLDPTMTPEFIGSQQALHRLRFEQKPPRRSPSTFEPTGLQVQYRSETDKIELGEAPR